MQVGMWDILFNILLLIFWFRIWTDDDRDLVFNPYLAPISRLSNLIFDFLRPVFFGASSRVICLVALLFLLVLRGLAVPANAIWDLTLGFEKVARPTAAPVVSCLGLSFLSFALFLFKVWGFALIYPHSRPHSSSDHASASLHYFSRPFSNARLELRPLLLLAYGAAIAFLLSLAGAPAPRPIGPGATVQVVIAWQNSSPVTLLIELCLIALTGWIDLLLVIQSLVVLLVIGSWVSAFGGSGAVMMFCREWLDLLLGPLRRYPIRIGMLDLAPIVFLFALGLIHRVLMIVLLVSYGKLA